MKALDEYFLMHGVHVVVEQSLIQCFWKFYVYLSLDRKKVIKDTRKLWRHLL